MWRNVVIGKTRCKDLIIEREKQLSSVVKLINSKKGRIHNGRDKNSYSS